MDNLVHHKDGAYCYACGYKDFTEEYKIMSKAVQPLKKLTKVEQVAAFPSRKIYNKVCAKYQVGVKQGHSSPVVCFPFYRGGELVAYKYKTPDKKIWWDNGQASFDYMGSNCHNGTRHTLVITEGEEDCLAIAQTVGEYIHVTSLHGGAESAKAFAEQYYKKLMEYQTIVLSFDMDEPGRKAVRQFMSVFPVGKVADAKLPLKDACEMLKEGKDEQLKWAIIKAEIPKPDGVLCVRDLTADYFNVATPRGFDLVKYPILNDKLAGLRKGELTMVSAGTGLGKSTWCTDVIVELIKAGKKIADIKLEESQIKTLYHYMALYGGVHFRKFREDPSIISKDKKQAFIEEYSNLYIHNHFGSLDSNDLLNVIDYYATIIKVDYILLDHISIVISGNEGGKDGERKQIDKLTTKIRELIERTGVGFLCVSHLRNPPQTEGQWEEGRPIRRNDLRGSGALAQLSDNIIGIEGNLRKEEEKFIRRIKLIKTRYGDEQEVYCDEYTWDVETGSIQIYNAISKAEPF